MAIKGEITAGDFAAFISYLTLMTWPMMAMGWAVTLLQRGKASMDRIEGLLSIKPVVSEQPDSVNVFEIKGYISFNNMGFSMALLQVQTISSGILTWIFLQAQFLGS